MRPADQLDKVFRVVTNADVAVTGLVTGNFTIAAWHTPYEGSTATWTHNLVVSELGSGWYRARFDLPSTAGQWILTITHATHIVNPAGWEDELEAFDNDAIASLVARPVVRVAANGTIGSQVTLDPIIAYRKSVITIGVLRADGTPEPIHTGYTNWAVGFRDPNNQDLTPPRLDAIHGTPTDFGLVIAEGSIEVTIPDDLSVFGVLTEGATPLDSAIVDIEIVADNPSGQTISVIAPSPLTIRKRAHGSGTP